MLSLGYSIVSLAFNTGNKLLNVKLTSRKESHLVLKHLCLMSALSLFDFDQSNSSCASDSLFINHIKYFTEL